MLKDLDLYLLIGQSNMAGRGNLDEVNKLIIDQIYVFRNDKWIIAEEPLHTDKPRIAGVGLGMSFAKAVFEINQRSIGLIPCAVGGTPLSRWLPGQDLYQNAINITKNALKYGSLKAILWHQGEGDSGELNLANTYSERYSEMIISLRKELNIPSVPFIAGELGPFLARRDECLHHEIVNQQLHQTGNKISSYKVVSSTGMTDKGDSLHFDSKSLREFGQRYAKAYQEFV